MSRDTGKWKYSMKRNILDAQRRTVSLSLSIATYIRGWTRVCRCIHCDSNLAPYRGLSFTQSRRLALISFRGGTAPDLTGAYTSTFAALWTSGLKNLGPCARSHSLRHRFPEAEDTSGEGIR